MLISVQGRQNTVYIYTLNDTSSFKPKTWKIARIYCFSNFFREKKLSRISLCWIFRGNNFREFAQNSRKSRKFLSAKVSSFKVFTLKPRGICEFLLKFKNKGLERLRYKIQIAGWYLVTTWHSNPFMFQSPDSEFLSVQSSCEVDTWPLSICILDSLKPYNWSWRKEKRNIIKNTDDIIKHLVG